MKVLVIGHADEAVDAVKQGGALAPAVAPFDETDPAWLAMMPSGRVARKVKSRRL